MSVLAVVGIVAGIVLLAFGALCCLGNWECVIEGLIGPRAPSLVPFGGLFAFAGCALWPAIGWRWGLVALAADPFDLMLAAWPVVALVQARRERRRLPRAQIVTREPGSPRTD